MKKVLNKLLHILPGFAVWFFLIFPVFFGIFYPSIFFSFVTFLTVYWVYRVIVGNINVISGYRKYKKAIKKDWYAEIKKLNFENLPNPEILPSNYSELKHFILIPIYSEPLEILRDNFLSIYESNYDVSKFTIVYAIEEKYYSRVYADLVKIHKEIDINNKVTKLFYMHPKGIPGEAIGVAGANRDWGARKGLEDLKKKKENLNNYIYTTFDCDTIVHKNFFSCLTHTYLTSEKRDNKFYETAVHIFDNNTWEVPNIPRVAADSITIALLASWSNPDSLFTTSVMSTFSCYSCSLKAAIKTDFYDTKIGIDDTMFYWRAYKAHDGDFEGVPFFIPIHLDAAEGSTFIESHKALYKQQLRWGWGIISFPIAAKYIFRAKKASIFDKIAHIWEFIDIFVVLRVTALILALGINVLALFLRLLGSDKIFNPEFYTLNTISSILLGIMSFFLVIPLVIIYKLKKPIPKEWGFFKRATLILDIFGIYINFYTFGFIPWIQAQTNMMLGKKYKTLYATEKFRK